MIYVFPAVFDYDVEEKAYNVSFPDIRGCLTFGYSRKQAVENAEDVLNLMLWGMEYNGKDIPVPTDINALSKPEQGFLSYVLADTEKYSAVMVKENPDKNFDLSRIKKEPEVV
ncbi:MAG: type II toxin-antitoxin system HicB family antitoxin [Synergistaceae bacterium]|nr:type II toxin-antitoxin system HicB family antitoxin [Synergistaceae bacterium]